MDCPLPIPAEGTVERWCFDLVTTTDPAAKLAPPAPPARWEEEPRPRVLDAPGRPAAWRLVDKAPRSVRRGALRDPARRAELIHTFAHHELQAAELMAWAVLAFAAAPAAFRRGLLRLATEELRHLDGYLGYLRDRGVAFGDYPLRDWFWSRVPTATTPAAFVATMGLGFEGGNLDHTERFEAWFREVGDGEAAELVASVRRDEVGHVLFAAHWFREWTGSLEFDAWRRSLPAPLSPMLMRGFALNTRDRRAGGMDDRFLEELAAWCPESPGS